MIISRQYGVWATNLKFKGVPVMEQKISDLEPKRVFAFFEELTRIPRESGNEKAVSDYLVDFANKRGLLAYQDEHNNVTLLKPATSGMEDKETVILQAHMDMVCVADKTAACNPAKDPVDAYIDGDYIRARGTSLGADDGIGIALILAVLDSTDISHPMIEAVFTADEEVGLNGANGYDCSRLKGKRFINIDTEEENHIVVGCCGGIRCNLSSKCKNTKIEGNIYDISISQLTGGHSGTDIHKGRANANVLMGRLFSQAVEDVEFFIGSYDGGTAENSIAASARATVVVKKKQTKAFEKHVKSFTEAVISEYKVSDPDMQIKCKDKGKGKLEVMQAKDASRFISLLNLLPNGVTAMSQTADMVETSSNIGIALAKPKSFSVCISLRSNSASSLEWMISKVGMIAKALAITPNFHGWYPAWEGGSGDFAKNAQVLYRNMFDRDIEVISIHAGLECSVFSQKIKGIEAISIGPDMEGVHSVSEKLSVSSTKREWEFLKELLKL